MNLPFFNRLPVKKISVLSPDTEVGQRAKKILEGLLQDLPDLLLTYLVDIQTGRLLAFYTASSTYNPHHVSLRSAKLLQTLDASFTKQPWMTGPLTDISVILEDQLHYLCPCNNGQWGCFLATYLKDANLGIAKKIASRHTT